MNSVELYIADINGDLQRLDLFEDEGISIVDSIQDVKDIKKIFNVFSRDFKVPTSFENNKIFKHYYDNKIDNGFDGRVKTRAIIKIGGVDYKKGYITILSVTKKLGKAIAYKLNFEGETISLKDIIRDDKIGDLDYTAITFDNTRENRVEGIRNGLYANALSSEDDDGYDLYPDIIFVPIFSGGKAVAQPYGQDYSATNSLKPTDNSYDFSLVKFTGAGVANTSSAPSGVDTPFINPSNSFKNFPITPFDFKTGVKVGRLLKMIDDKYQELIFENSFIHREEIDQMYMLFNKKIEKGVTQNVNEAFNNTNSSIPSSGVNSYVYTTVNYINNTPDNTLVLVKDDGSAWGRIANPTQNQARLAEGIFVCEENRASESVDVTIKKFSIDNATGVRTDLLVTTISDIQSGQTYPRNGLNLSAWEDGMGVLFDVTFSSSQPLDGLVDFRFDVDWLEFPKQRSVSTQSISAQVIDIKNTAPDIKVMDLITGLFKMFNMTSYVEDGKIIIKELEDYYKEGVSHDITSMVDISSGEVSPGFNYKNVKMDFQESDDVLTKYFNGDGNFGSIEIDKNSFVEDDENPSTSIELKKGKDYSISLPFSTMMFENLYLGFDSSQNLIGDYSNGGGGLPTDIVIGNQIDGKLQEVETKPILFFGKQVDTSKTFIQPESVGDAEDIGDIGGYADNGIIHFGNTAGIYGSVSNGRDLILTESTSSLSNNDYGLSTIDIFLSDDLSTEIGKIDSNKWWNPSNIMATRYKRNGDFINPFNKYQGISFDNNVYDEFENQHLLNPSVWTNGLYHTNYERYLKNVYAKNARIKKFKVKLSETLLIKYSLKDSFRIGAEEYNINKINIDILTGEGTVELINKIYFEEISGIVTPPVIPDTEAPVIASLSAVSLPNSTSAIVYVDITDNVSVAELEIRTDTTPGSEGTTGARFDLINGLNGTSVTMEETVTGLASNATTNISLRARDSSGNYSTWSNVTVTTISAPVAPNTPTLTGSFNRFSGGIISLSVGNLLGSDSFDVYHKIGTATSFTLVTSVNSVDYDTPNTKTLELSHAESNDGEWYVIAKSSSGLSSSQSTTYVYEGSSGGVGGPT